MPKISVIVPVYNAEDYIHQCINSVVKQTYTDFELILVDDGSKDMSAEICDEYAQKDNRISVIHQENSGVSAARNAGLDAAKGEYIAFLDSDDWFDLSFLQKCMERINSSDYDMCVTGFCLTNGNVKTSRTFGKEISFESRSVTPNCVKELLEHSLISNIWAKLYRRQVIGETRFDTDVNFGEDLRFCFEILKKNISVTVLDWAGYFYRLTPTGLTSNRVNEKKCRSVVKTYQYLYHHAKETGFCLNEEYMVFLDKRWCQDFFGVAYNIVENKLTWDEKRKLLGILASDQNLCDRLKAMSEAPISDPDNLCLLCVSFWKQKLEAILQEAKTDAKNILKKVIHLKL